MVDRVVVSTDCPYIYDEAENLGAEVIRRPREISGDYAKSEDTVLDAIEQLRWDGDFTLMVQCTSPLTLSADINGVLALLHEHDSVFTAVPFHGFVWRNGEFLQPVNHRIEERQRRQDIREWVENGAVYGFDTGMFKDAKNRFFGKIGMYEMPEERGIEIDYPYQLMLAEKMMLKNFHTNGERVRKETDGVHYC
jgi:N-acylneuraminate cytidylyltransferase